MTLLRLTLLVYKYSMTARNTSGCMWFRRSGDGISWGWLSMPRNAWQREERRQRWAKTSCCSRPTKNVTSLWTEAQHGFQYSHLLIRFYSLHFSTPVLFLFSSSCLSRSILQSLAVVLKGNSLWAELHIWLGLVWPSSPSWDLRI